MGRQPTQPSTSRVIHTFRTLLHTFLLRKMRAPWMAVNGSKEGVLGELYSLKQLTVEQKIKLVVLEVLLFLVGLQCYCPDQKR